MPKKKDNFLTDEEVEIEIAKLQKSPYVKLARKEERIRYQRRQQLYGLRVYEKKGKELAKAVAKQINAAYYITKCFIRSTL